MAFVTCEFSESLKSPLTFGRLMQSVLVTRCLGAENMASVSPYLDENFLISVAQLALKTWIKAAEEEREENPNPFKAFEAVLKPRAESSQLQYLEL